MAQKYLALSRSTHGILDVAFPAFVALLWLGHFPSFKVIVLGIITAIAGYTAIYALNDLVGIKGDREKIVDGKVTEGYSVEASDFRYPLAQNILTLKQGWYWFGFWYLITLLGAWLLRPMLVWIVIAAPLLETLYCRLHNVSFWRIIVSGIVKSLGPIAAVFAVIESPALEYLLLMLLWIMTWEIGGQNILADWNDVDEDTRVGAKTIPVIFGPEISGKIVVVALLTTVFLSLFLPLISPLPLGLLYLIGTFVIGLYCLLIPCFNLLKSKEGRLAAKLFDRASFYPLFHLLLILPFIIYVSLS